MSLVYQRYRSSFTVRLWSAVRLQLVQITCRQQVDFLFFQYFNTFIHITRTNHNVCHVIIGKRIHILNKDPFCRQESQHFCQSSRHIRTANADHICYIHGKMIIFQCFICFIRIGYNSTQNAKISIFSDAQGRKIDVLFASTSVTSVKRPDLFSKKIESCFATIIVKF